MARLLIVNDRRDLVELLMPDLIQLGHEVVGHCWTARQVLPAAETDHDVVLMNLDLPSDMHSAPLVGFALTEALLERDPNERVLFSTSSRWPSRPWRQAGSSGWDDLLHLTGRRLRGARSREFIVHYHWPRLGPREQGRLNRATPSIAAASERSLPKRAVSKHPRLAAPQN